MIFLKSIAIQVNQAAKLIPAQSAGNNKKAAILKSFLTYKHLLAIHHLKKDEEINLFDLLVNGVLKHFTYSLTGGKEMGELWAQVKEDISRTTGRNTRSTRRKQM